MTPPDSRPRPPDTPWRVWLARHGRVLLFGLALALVLGLYLRQWTFNRSLWMDEAYLALNIRHRTFQTLLQPLDNHQTAPIGYLWSVKACQQLLGEAEWSLRLPTCGAAIGALLLFALVARRCLRLPAATLALLFYGGAVMLTRYATELKPYAFDVLAGNALMALCLLQSHSVRWRLAFALTTLAAPLFSYASLFLGPAAILVCWVRSLQERQIRSTLWLALHGALWLAWVALLYVKFLRSTDQSTHFEDFWGERYNAFMILPPWSPAGLQWWADFWAGLSSNLFYYWTTSAVPLHFLALLTLALLPFGAIHLWRNRHAPLVAFWLLAFSFALALSCLRQYPLHGRVMLYLLPPYLLLLAAAFQRAFTIPPSRIRNAVIAVVILLSLFPLGTILYTTVKPIEPRQARAVYETLCRKFKPGDLVYLNHYDWPTYEFYQQLLPLPPHPVIGITDHQSGDGSTLRHAFTSLGHHRSWIVIGHISRDEGADETRELLATLAAHGTVSPVKKAKKATLYLFEPASPL